MDLVDWEDITYDLDDKLVAELRDQILESNEGKIRKSHLRLRQLAVDLAQTFDQMPRAPTGGIGEGAIVVLVSDKLSRIIAATLRAAARADD
jgi:hypothetical protein